MTRREPFENIPGESVEDRARRVLDYVLPRMEDRDHAVERVCLRYPANNPLEAVAGALYVLGVRQ